MNHSIKCEIIQCLEGQNVSCSSPILTISKYNKPGCDYNFTLPSGPNLREFHFRNVSKEVDTDNFELSTICLHPDNAMLVLDIADNPGLKDLLNGMNIKGLHGLQHLNLNNTGLEMSNSSFLGDFPGLKYRMSFLWGNTS